MASLTRPRGLAVPREAPRSTAAAPPSEADRAQSRTESLAAEWGRSSLSLRVRYQEGGRVRQFKNLYEETVGHASKRLKGACIWPANGIGASYLVLGRGDWALGSGCGIAGGAWDLEMLAEAQRRLAFSLGQALCLNPSAAPILTASFFSLPSPQGTADSAAKILHPKCLAPLFLREFAEFSNRFGVPAPSGGVCFDGSAAPGGAAVIVESLAMMPAKAAKQRARAGDAVVLISSRGGPGGAAFDEVQQAMAQAFRREFFYRAVALGAGGLAEAVLGLSAGRGVSISLEKAAAPDQAASPEELWLSKQDGLFLLAASRGACREIEGLFKERGLDAREIGAFTDTGRVDVSWNEVGFVRLDEKEALAPRRADPVKAVWMGAKTAKRSRSVGGLSASALLRALIADLGVASREWLVRQMDVESQGHTVIKPLQGLRHDGPGDACVLWPHGLTGDSADHRAFAFGCGLSQRMLALDPALAAAFACDEALRNVVCVGGDAARAGFWARAAWPEWREGEELGAVARWLQGLGTAVAGYGVPVVAHQSRFGGRASFFTVSAAAPLADMRKAVTLDIKGPGNPVYLVGLTGEELAGSLYAALWELPGDGFPKIAPRQAMAAFKAVARAISSGLVLSAHDLADGGLAVAAAQMGFSGEFGLHLDLDLLPRHSGAIDDLKLLVAETPSRILLEVRPEKERDVARILRGLPARRIGETIANPILKIKGLDGSVLLEESLSQLKALWQAALPEALGIPARS